MSYKTIGVEKEKNSYEKKKEKKNLCKNGKLIQKNPIFRLYKTRINEHG